MEIKLLKQLCEAPGLPGAEEPVGEIIISDFVVEWIGSSSQTKLS
ncbi:MAG: hypothetical protein ACREOW_05605 [Thermodesulfobacteriota bacterium]